MSDNKDIEIPDLKKKEQERKKAGAAFGGGGSPGGTAFSGARAAASAASSAGAGAPAGTSFLAGLTATLAGKAVAAGAAALVIGGVGAAGYSVFNGGGAPARVVSAGLGGLSSTVKVHEPRVDRTGYVDSRGELAFEAPAPKKAEQPKTEAPAAPVQQAAQALEQGGIGTIQDGAPDQAKDRLAHDLKGAKLSSGFGSSASSFGSKDIFAGKAPGGKFGEAALAKGALSARAQPGSLQRGRASGRAALASRRGARKIVSSKALGQLQAVSGLSAGVASGTNEAASAAATNAFENQTVEAGQIQATFSPDAVVPPNPGGGGGGGGGAADPKIAANEAKIKAIADLAKQAGETIRQGQNYQNYGLALIALGCCVMWFNPWWGWALIAAGIGLYVAGQNMIGQGHEMEKQAREMNDKLAAETQDKHQQAINDYCIGQAVNGGVAPENCNPPDSVTQDAQITQETQTDVGKQKEVAKPQ